MRKYQKCNHGLSDESYEENTVHRLFFLLVTAKTKMYKWSITKIAFDQKKNDYDKNKTNWNDVIDLR